MSKRKIFLLVISVTLTISFLLFFEQSNSEQSKSADVSPYKLRNSVIGGAGSFGSSDQYQTAGTLGQSTPIGIGTAADKTLRAGFWGRYWIPTAVDETPPIYRDELYQNYPNPFNPVTTIEYSVARECAVEITIFNVNGQRIKTLLREDKLPGKYRVRWDGRNDAGRMAATGIYFYRLRVGSFVSVKKMLLLR